MIINPYVHSPVVSPGLLSEIFGQTGGVDPANMTKPTGWTTTSATVYAVFNDYGPSYPGINPCDVVGSSGAACAILQGNNVGAKFIKTKSFYTVGKTNITLSWNACINDIDTADPGGFTIPFPTITLFWSTDNVTFTPITYTEVTFDDLWHAVSPIVLPVGAENQATVYIRWNFTGNGNGCYYMMDDVLVTGT